MKIPKFRDKEKSKRSSGLPPSRLKKSKNKQSSGLPPSRLKKSKNKQSSGLPPSRRPKKPKKRIKPLSRWHPRLRQVTDWGVISASVLLCLFLLPQRFPGMELLGIGANWLLIWVVAWSINRSAFQGAFAGIILGLLQDGMTSANPTHAVSLGVVGFLVGLFQKQRFIQEDFISIALIVFVMATLSDTIFALQLIGAGTASSDVIWTYYQKVTLASAILSSLWGPVVYYPLNRWWQQLKLAEQNS